MNVPVAPGWENAGRCAGQPRATGTVPGCPSRSPVSGTSNSPTRRSATPPVPPSCSSWGSRPRCSAGGPASAPRSPTAASTSSATTTATSAARRSSPTTARRPPLQLLRRDKKAAAYTLADMADDGVGLLDGLGIDRAHVVGASMGGMIAQTIAFRHPDRSLSLVSIMSNTGARFSGQPSLSMYGTLLKRAPRDREGYIDPPDEDVREDRLARLPARRGRPARARDRELRPRARPRRRRAPARGDHRLPRPVGRARRRSASRRSSSTARRTSSSRPRAAGRRRRRSPARGS